MPRNVIFKPNAFDDYNYWAVTDKKIFERLVMLIIDTQRSPFSGIGKPEPLKGALQGYWSRRITDEHRLVYKVTDDDIIITACRYHYSK
jgi:toxin YoeB